VRVDGFPIEGIDKKVVEAPAKEAGTICSNNGTTCLVTPGGEVWVCRPMLVLVRGTFSDLRSAEIEALVLTLPEEDQAKARGVLNELTPNRGGNFVYFSNGEVTSPYYLLQRFGDPDWEPRPH